MKYGRTHFVGYWGGDCGESGYFGEADFQNVETSRGLFAGLGVLGEG